MQNISMSHLTEPVLWQQEIVKKKKNCGGENSRKKTDKAMGVVGGMF